MAKPVFRFAPSPNGFLHLGHAYSALFTWNEAKQAGGQVLLRIEDIDTGRCRSEYTAQIYDDLKWLGLSWPEPVRVQSAHFDDYRKAAAVLTEKGLLYPCFCSRKQVASAARSHVDPDGAPRYGGTCRHLTDDEVSQRCSNGEVFAMRLDMSRVIEKIGPLEQNYANLTDWGDVVIVRKDIATSYHLSVVVDDALQGVTHVSRGMDMYAATAIHMALQTLLELPTPDYIHHQLIADDTGRKLAKSYGDLSLKTMRAGSFQPESLLALPLFCKLALLT